MAREDTKMIESCNYQQSNTTAYYGGNYRQNYKNFDNSSSQAASSRSTDLFMPPYYASNGRMYTKAPYSTTNLPENKPSNSRAFGEQAYDPLADNSITNYDFPHFKKQKTSENNFHTQNFNTNSGGHQPFDHQNAYGRQKFKNNKYNNAAANSSFHTTIGRGDGLNEVKATFLVNQLSFEQYKSKCILSCTNQEDKKAMEEYLVTLEPLSGEKNWDSATVASAMDAIRMQRNITAKLDDGICNDTKAMTSEDEGCGYDSRLLYKNRSRIGNMSSNFKNVTCNQVKQKNQNYKNSSLDSIGGRSTINYSLVVDERVNDSNKTPHVAAEAINTRSSSIAENINTRSSSTAEAINARSSSIAESSFFLQENDFKDKSVSTSNGDKEIDTSLSRDPIELIKRREKFQIPSKIPPNRNSKQFIDEYHKTHYQIIGTCEDIEKPYLRLTTLPDPSLIRSESVLKKALLNVKKKQELSADPHYIWEQMKSIRQDLTIQDINNEFAVEVYEYHARLCLQNEDWKEFKECITKLKQFYQHYLIKGNENEFTAYHILYTIFVGNTCEINSILDHLPEYLVDDPFVEHSIQILNYYTSNNWYRFFKVAKNTPNLGGYIVKKIAKNARIQSLLSIFKSHKFSISLAYVKDVLGFDCENDCFQYLKKKKCCIDSGNFIDPKQSIANLLDYIENMEISKS